MAYIDTTYSTRSKRSHRKPWKAVVSWDGRRHSLGYYATQEEAERRECLEYDRYIAEEFYMEDHATYPYS